MIGKLNYQLPSALADGINESSLLALAKMMTNLAKANKQSLFPPVG